MALYLRAKDRLGASTQAYLYKWTHVPTQKWYVGSRTASGSNPSDGYFCSSKIVKPMIIANPSDWSREVLAISDTQYILDLETKYLVSVDAKNDPLCFNRHNGDGKLTSTGINASSATRNKMSMSRSGIAKSDEHRNAISAGLQNSKLVKNRKGEQTSRFAGYYISPEKQRYSSSWEASAKHGVAATTIRRWAKNNTNGWTFQPKGDN